MSSYPKRVGSWDCFQRAKAGAADKASLRVWLEPNSCPGGDKGFTIALLDRGAQNHQDSPGKAVIHGKGASYSQ